MRGPDAQLAAAIAVPLIPVGMAFIAFSPRRTAFIGDGLDPFRDAASEGLIVAGALYAVAYLLTRHPRWVLVVALALGFGADLQSATPVPVVGIGVESWSPALILCAAAAVALVAALALRKAPAEQLNLLVAAAIMLAAASETRTFASSADAGDLFYAGVLAAELAIAAWRTTPAVAVSIALTGGFLAESLSQRSGLIGVAVALAGAALAGGATIWTIRSRDGLDAAAGPPRPPAAA
jgi:hypothetical protein